MGLPAERSDDDLDRPPGAWIPVVVIGGLAVFGAISLFQFVFTTLFGLIKVGVVAALVIGVIYVLTKGYRD